MFQNRVPIPNADPDPEDPYRDAPDIRPDSITGYPANLKTYPY
jgi:hypothetical protein